MLCLCARCLPFSVGHFFVGVDEQRVDKKLVGCWCFQSVWVFQPTRTAPNRKAYPRVIDRRFPPISQANQEAWRSTSYILHHRNARGWSVLKDGCLIEKCWLERSHHVLWAKLVWTTLVEGLHKDITEDEVLLLWIVQSLEELSESPFVCQLLEFQDTCTARSGMLSGRLRRLRLSYSGDLHFCQVKPGWADIVVGRIFMCRVLYYY